MVFLGAGNVWLVVGTRDRVFLVRIALCCSFLLVSTLERLPVVVLGAEGFVLLTSALLVSSYSTAQPKISANFSNA